jgi:hypothetical protein
VREPPFWERLGERIGYGLAAIVLGPAAALERRTRRSIRRAMLDYVRDLEPMKLESRRGLLGRNVSLRAAAGATLPAEIEVDLEGRRARVVVQFERLPAFVDACISRDVRELDELPHRPTGWVVATTPTNVRLDSDTLDGPAAEALVAAIAAGPLSSTDAFELTISPDRMTLITRAPITRAGWTSIGEGVIAAVAWLIARWPSSYRG